MPAVIIGGVDPRDPGSPRAVIVEALSAEMASHLAAKSPDVIVEPEILHWPVTMPPPDLSSFQRLTPSGPGAVPPLNRVTIVALADEAPLPGATVKLYLRNLGSVQEIEGLTRADGSAAFDIPAGAEAAAALVVPEHSFWSMIARGDAMGQPVICPRLPADGPSGWWHKLTGSDDTGAERGGGIQVGVVDSGAGPHLAVDHADLVGCFFDGVIQLSAAGAVDAGCHGTHVAGTIGARPTSPGGYGGLAPDCRLFVARVFRDAKSGATNADIANAVEVLSRDHGVDLINLSLGTPVPSEVVRVAIAEAADRGTLCLCAAGNDGGEVNYPAAFQEAVAVSAVGLAGWGPVGSLSASRLPVDNALFGRQNLYAANFTSHGSAVACTSPGIGIIAPVPSRSGFSNPYAAMDGTSMACPSACGALAVLLSRNDAYKALPRDRTRAIAAKRILASASRDIGLPQVYQGRGMPSVNQGIA